MSSNAQRGLIIATYMLSRSAPKQWEDFEKAFAEYVRERVEEAVQAQADIAHVAHGRAQSLLALRTTFQEIKPKYEAIEKKSR